MASSVDGPGYNSGPFTSSMLEAQKVGTGTSNTRSSFRIQFNANDQVSMYKGTSFQPLALQCLACIKF